MPQYLWIDTLKNNWIVPDVETQDPEFAKEEFTHVAALEKELDSVLKLLIRSDMRGALLFFIASDDAAAKRKVEEIPVIKRGYGEYKLIRYENFVSVQRLFGQGGKYSGDPVRRTKPLHLATGLPCSFWLILETSSSDDIAYVWRMKKGGIARVIYDMVQPSNGLLVDVVAQDEDEARDIAKQIPSIRKGEAGGKWSILGGIPAAAYDIFF